MQVLSPGSRLTTLIVRLPSSTTASAAANIILAQANELLAAAAATAAGPSSSADQQQQQAQAQFSECHLLAYTSSSAGYPQRKPQPGSGDASAGRAAAGWPTSAGEQTSKGVLQELVASYSKRRADLLTGRTQLREVDAAERLNDPWWYQNELLVVLLPADPAAAAAAGVHVGCKCGRESEEPPQRQQVHVLVLQSVQNSCDWLYDGGTQLLPLLVPLQQDGNEDDVKQAIEVGCKLSLLPQQLPV
jgi:hypothetical protein